MLGDGTAVRLSSPVGWECQSPICLHAARGVDLVARTLDDVREHFPDIDTATAPRGLAGLHGAERPPARPAERGALRLTLVTSGR